MKLTNPFLYDHRSVELKWRDTWQKVKVDLCDIARAKKPYYNLMMFPYPSAEGLHVGNMYAFTGSDIYGRFKRMQGHDVFEPIGLDGFGIHSENYALKIGRHPMDHAAITQKNFYSQLQTIGAMFDWNRTVETYDPLYYRWTQWLFVQMFQHGLAYRGKANVNWCPGCKTVLADEQVIDGVCERCGNIVGKRLLEQWFFRITAYAGKLLEHLDSLDWSEKIKIAQRNWIGEKEGITITYKVRDSDLEIVCFTTTPVNFAATFLVLSPEHPLAERVVTSDRLRDIKDYIDIAKRKTQQERIVQGREKTGVFTGSYAINHVTNEAMPIWISDFVIMSVGTGAIQGCPGHDMRDFEFAKKYKLPIKRVVVGIDGDISPIERKEQVIGAGEKGTMVNSDFLNGLDYTEAMEKTKKFFEKKGWGKRVVTYHLRDWLISRQRYWGPPIPMIYCRTCASKGKSWFTTEEASRVSLNDKFPMSNDQSIGNWKPALPAGGLEIGNSMQGMAGWYPVPEDQLPVILPRIEDYKPGDDGIAPLAKHKEFYQTSCPGCGGKAIRETDVSDTFLDSSWYFLRYPSVARNLEDGRWKMDIESGRLDVLNAQDVKKSKVQDPTSKISNFKKSQSLPWNREITRKWLPVDMYTGGAEHAVLHLMYSRFIWKALRDWGYLDFSGEAGSTSGGDEPFTHFFAHGLVIKDGAKMSKSKGNIINPDTYIQQYGADALRLYLMFMGPFNQGGDFRDTAMEGMSRWVGRVWRIAMSSIAKFDRLDKFDQLTINRTLHKLIKKVGEDTQKRRYNTAIAAMMSFTNLVSDEVGVLTVEKLEQFILLLAPYAPYLAEELWQRLRILEDGREKMDIKRGNLDVLSSQNVKNSKVQDQEYLPSNFKSVHKEPWPTYDPSLLEEVTVVIIVQVNGKRRDRMSVPVERAGDQASVESMARSSHAVKKFLTGKAVKKVIFVPNKIVNFVI